MEEYHDVNKLYKNGPNISPVNVVEENSFTALTLLFKSSLGQAFDSLSYIAGIKSAPADAKCKNLDTTNLQSLLASARLAGYDVEVLTI